MSREAVGSYLLNKCLMTGQSSQVWEVIEKTSQRHFAMKILLQQSAEVTHNRDMLFHEADVGKELTHPNVIRIQYVSPLKETVPYFVMDFFPAGSLKQRLQSKQNDFIKEWAHSIFKQAATGLAYMNASGWVHRDIKPDNMLVNSAGELRLIDFAIAQRIRENTLFTRISRRLMGKGPVMGTRSYMSPEQIRNEALDGRADIYSFGATVYELMCHRPPFRGTTNQELLQKHIIEKPTPPQFYNAEITDEMNSLVIRMLAKKREDRPENFHEVLRTLNSLRVYKSDPIRRK